MTAPDWQVILDEPFVSLILGQRGSGKTALGHLLLEDFGGPDKERNAYILGFPEHLQNKLPEWVEVLPPTMGRDNWPSDSVVLVHEAHQLLHARRSMDAENVEIDELVTVSRHRNSDIIFETQQSQRLDKNSVTAVDAIIFREPALMQADFERRQMRPIAKEAEKVFEKYNETIEKDGYTFKEKSPEVKKHAYIYSGRFVGEYPHEIGLADHWSENISKAYAEVSEDVGDGDSGLSGDEQTALNAVAEWEVENRPLDYSHMGVNHKKVPIQRAWTELQKLHSKGLLKITYESSNKPNEYRLTYEGWKMTILDEPDAPELSETAQKG